MEKPTAAALIDRSLTVDMSNLVCLKAPDMKIPYMRHENPLQLCTHFTTEGGLRSEVLSSVDQMAITS